jgi:hypothetical protein
VVKGYNRVSESLRTKKKEIIPETFTFLDTTVKMDIENKLTSNQTRDKISNIEKDLKPRSIDSKKTRNRYNRMVGGHNQQGHSSVYE